MDDRRGAEKALGKYIAKKHEPSRRRDGDPDRTPIADVISIYLQDVAPSHSRPDETAQRFGALLSFFADPETVRRTLKECKKPARYDGFLTDIRGDSCRAYTHWRTTHTWKSARPDQTGNEARKVGTAAPRRELEDLRAAINYHRREGFCRQVIEVTLPERSAPREIWLTRSEAARLIWAAWRARDKLTGRPMGRHIARFILVALYTGTRAQAVCRAAVKPTPGHGWVDVEKGIFFRRGAGVRETKKRQTPVRLPRRLTAHIERWVRKDIAADFIVEWNGKPVQSIRKGFASAVNTAGLDKSATPHVLRHTAATWLMLNGTNKWDAAGFLGMSVQMLTERYGHHHPDYQADAAERITQTSSKVDPSFRRSGT